MILGSVTHGTPQNLPADQVYVRQVDIVDSNSRLAVISALLDGQGPGAAFGDAAVHPVAYSEAGDLLVVGESVPIVAGAGKAWRALRIALPGLELADSPWIGLRAIGTTNTARLYGVAPGAATAKTKAAAGQAPATLSGAATSTLEAALIADVFAAYTAPEVQDAALARLPWTLTQRYLGSTGAIKSSRRAARAGWHGRTTDSEQGANCLLRSDGPLADLVGERLRISVNAGPRRRSVAVYAHDERDFPPESDTEDLSLSRRAFQALAPLSADTLTVEVEVLA